MIRGKKANMILKIDLEKAFHRLEYAYIQDNVENFNIPQTIQSHNVLHYHFLHIHPRERKEN